MRVTAKLIMLGFTIYSFAAQAQREGDGSYGLVYLMALTLPQTAEVCSGHIPGYREQFDAVFFDWKKRNKHVIARGEVLMRGSNDKEIANIERDVSEIFARQSVSQIISSCDGYLHMLRAK